VHERRGGMPIAEPHQEAVDDLRRIATLIIDPPRVRGLGTMKVLTCALETSVGDASRTMRAGSFSQLPVYRGREFVGLLTSETIARWLGAELRHQDGILEDQPVSAVLGHRDESGVEEFASRERSLIEMIELFEQTVRSGKNLDAVLITHSGARHESPIYILTVFDLPRLYTAALSRGAA
jgi:predicted transcriptional regulator